MTVTKSRCDTQENDLEGNYRTRECVTKNMEYRNNNNTMRDSGLGRILLCLRNGKEESNPSNYLPVEDGTQVTEILQKRAKLVLGTVL